MRDLAGEGTPESDWARWALLQEAPVLDPAAVSGPLVVLAPHPDDDVLGVGGFLATLVGLGAHVTVVAVTDGEASHLGSPTVEPAALGERRRVETAAARRALGLGAAPVIRLRLPDGEVAHHEAHLAAHVERLLAPSGTCLATWAGDGHPDHEAVGRAAATACARAGARLLDYPVWTWHWATPADLAVPWEQLRRVLLTPEVAAAKRAAVGLLGTQVRPLPDDPVDSAVLTPAALARLLRDYETVLVP